MFPLLWGELFTCKRRTQLIHCARLYMNNNCTLYCITVQENPISFPEHANFSRRMLDENEGNQFLGDPDWSSEMQYNTISPLFADH